MSDAADSDLSDNDDETIIFAANAATTRHTNWYANLDAVKQFIAAHHMLPSSYRTTEPGESVLGVWLANQRRLHADGGGRRPDIWNDFVAENAALFADPHTVWLSHFDNARTFIATHQRLPSHIAADVAERHLGIWINNQKTTLTTTATDENSNRSAMWSAFVSDESHAHLFVTAAAVHEQNWADSLLATEQFIAKNARWPSKLPRKPADEIRLARWVDKQRAYYSKQQHGMADPIRRGCWEEFVAAQNVPSKRILPHSVATISLPQVVGPVRSLSSAYALVTPKVATHTNPKSTGNVHWSRALSEVRTFMTENQRLPSASAVDAFERRLGSWVVVQKRNAKPGAQNSKFSWRRNIWETFLVNECEHLVEQRGRKRARIGSKLS